MDIQRASLIDASPSSGYVDVTLRDGKPEFAGLATASFGTRAPGRVAGTAQGIHARWHWDGTVLSAEVDPYGFYSLYYCVEGNRVRVSPSVLQLAALGCDLTKDHRALTVFHRLGFFINDDTPFKNIKVLPAGGKLTWRSGKVTVEARERKYKELDITRSQAIDGYIDLFRQSISRTLKAWDGPIVSPLSGGRDSRHIMVELAHQGRKPDACITFQHGGDAWNAEVKAARAICEAVGVRHDVLGHVRSRQADILRAIVKTELCADEHAQMIPLHDYYLDRPAAAYDGIGGDVLSGDVLSRGDETDRMAVGWARAGDFRRIAKHMIDGHGRVISATADPRGAADLYSPGADEEALDYVAEAIAKHADAPNPIQVFFIMNRTRREISFVARGVLSSAGAVFSPYIDEDLADFCFSLPWEVSNMREKTFHDEVTDRAYPEFAHVPFENGFTSDPTPRTPLRHKLKSVVDMARVARFMATDTSPIEEFSILLGLGRPLGQGFNETMHIHDRLVDGLSPTRARDLLAFADALQQHRPRHLVSDSYMPPVSGTARD